VRVNPAVSYPVPVRYILSMLSGWQETHLPMG